MANTSHYLDNISPEHLVTTTITNPPQIRTFDYVLFYLNHHTMVRSMTRASVRGLKWIHSPTEIYIYIYIYTLLSCTKRILRGEGGESDKMRPPPLRNPCGFCRNNSITKHEGPYTRKCIHTKSYWPRNRYIDI